MLDKIEAEYGRSRQRSLAAHSLHYWKEWLAAAVVVLMLVLSWLHYIQLGRKISLFDTPGEATIVEVRPVRHVGLSIGVLQFASEDTVAAAEFSTPDGTVRRFDYKMGHRFRGAGTVRVPRVGLREEIYYSSAGPDRAVVAWKRRQMQREQHFAMMVGIVTGAFSALVLVVATAVALRVRWSSPAASK